MRFKHLLLASFCLPSLAVAAEPLPQLKAYEARPDWLVPIEPLRISDHVWQIGTAGISALLVLTPEGAVLIDAGMPQAGKLLLAQMKQLGVAHLRLILHSHAHIDHAGSLSMLKRATGALLVSNAESAVLLARGDANDIHWGDAIPFAPVQADRLLQDGEVVQLGGIAFTVHFTPGHTPGSMSWTWTDTKDGRPLRIAYVDSLTAPGYQLAANPGYPHIVEDFQRSIARVRALPCDLLLTPHPDASGWDYGNVKQPHPQPMTCTSYADQAEKTLQEKLGKELKKGSVP